MKKTLGILLALALALSLAVTALAGGKTTPPSGDNVVKLTSTSEDEEYQGDLYLVFSQLLKVVPADEDLYPDCMEYHIPAGSMVTFYWYNNGELRSLDPETGVYYEGYFLNVDETGSEYLDSTYPEKKVNDDGSITLTFADPAYYYYDGDLPVEPTPFISVEEAAASDTPTEPAPTEPAPTEPAPTEPAPTEPAPTEPVPTEPAPTEPTPTPDPEPERPFTDVPNWCAEAAAYMAAHNIMNGTGDNKFSPNDDTTRGMVMTILARAAGVNTASGNPWYQVGMEWSMSAKISDGTNPEKNVTRQELATMIWRYFKEPASDKTPAFPDVSSVSSYAVTAVNWCVENGIINGKDGLLDPKGFATRAETAAMVYRALTKFAS